MKRFLLSVPLFFLLASSAFAITAEEEQALIDRVFSIFAETSTGLNDSLPPVRTCGTSILTEMMTQFSELSPRVQAILQQGPFDREPGFERYDTPSGHFRIHYVDTGIHAVRDPLVKVNRGGQLIPVWVDTLAMVLDSIWEKEILQLGYRAPVADDFYPEGEDGRFDVYLKGLSPTFIGATVPERTSTSPCDPDIFGPLCNRATAYIILDNDYDFSPYNNPLYGIGPSGAMRVTAAHEFFHAIQFAYTAFNFETVGGQPKLYWQEATAVWMEDQVYNEINDYIQYLPFWFDAPGYSFRTFQQPSGSDIYQILRPYALAIYGHYLSKRFPNPTYGYSVVRRVWESMATVSGFNLFQAIDSALGFAGFMSGASYPERFLASLQEFYHWNYFVGRNSPLNVSFYAPEDSFWPTFNSYRAVDSTVNYPTRFPRFTVPCGNCPPDYVKFFCAPCSTNAIGLPCSTKCPPTCRFIPYQVSPSATCGIDYFEDLGASYLVLQNPGRGGSYMDFALKSDTANPAPFTVSLARDSTGPPRSYSFLTETSTDSSGRTPDLFLSGIRGYSEVIATVVNKEFLPAGAGRQYSAFAYSANVDSSIPPGFTEVVEGRPNPFRPGIDEKVRFPIALDSLSGIWKINLVVYSSAGEVVYRETLELPGSFSSKEALFWEGKNNSGRPVASGVYFCKIIMEEKGASRKLEKLAKIALIRQ
ncbi:MAG: hypothetical protein L0196_03235 [candidate division Zixibacteria bacterium]|nr:hypothetical protein [candidate division Zixibacteria bacterium]